MPIKQFVLLQLLDVKKTSVIGKLLHCVFRCSAIPSGIADLLLLRTLLAICQKPQELSFWEAIDSLVLLAYASLEASRTLTKQSLASLNPALDSKYLFCWFNSKKWFLRAMAGAQAAENHGDEWAFAWCLPWGTYTPILTRTHSQNSLAPEAPSLKISSHGISLK